jgi:hypothetical protein
MTAVQLNDLMIKEYQRLGSREPIDAVLKSFGVTGINDLDPSHYQAVIDALKAV